MRPARLSGEGADAMWTSLSITEGEIRKEPSTRSQPARRAPFFLSKASGIARRKAPQQAREVPREARDAPPSTPVIELSVELLKAAIVRPWMDPLVLRSRAWRFSDDREPLSNGGVPPSGSLPAYISSIVLARNLRVELRRTPRGLQKPGQPIGPCGVGPLSLEGGVVADDCRSICAAGPQIVAFICELVPRSPDPDPRLSF